MRTRDLLTTLVACLLLLALPASSAWANASDDRILHDCGNSADSTLRGSYTQKQLHHALNNIPTDQLEYSGCYDAIQQALNTGASGDGNGNGRNDGGGGTGTGGGGSGSTGGDFGANGGGDGAEASTPPPDVSPPAGAEQPIDVAGTAIAPGALPEIGKDSHRLPTALLVLLVLLGLAALVPAALTIGRRVVGHRGA